jgi:hypothetical protein
MAQRTPRVLGFWGLFPAPFLVYELLLREAVDPGACLPFVLPPLAALAGYGVAAIANPTTRLHVVGMVLALAWLASLVAPSVARFAREWDDPRQATTAHFTPLVLAAVWMAANLPEQAVVVGPPLPVNPNVVPYYSRRRPIILPDRLPMLLRDPRPYTPMNLSSYEPLTTGRLRTLIDEGVPVYALRDNPIARREGSDAFDPDAFRWIPAMSADVRAVARDLGLEAVANPNLDSVVIHRCENFRP